MIQTLDNPWLVGQEQYDRQMREPATRCRVCGEASSEVTEYPNGDLVCDGCEAEYLDRWSGEFVEDYINGEEAEGYYLEWWFGSLPGKERLRIAREAYARLSGAGLAEAAGDQRRYIDQCCGQEDVYKRQIIYLTEEKCRLSGKGKVNVECVNSGCGCSPCGSSRTGNRSQKTADGWGSCCRDEGRRAVLHGWEDSCNHPFSRGRCGLSVVPSFPTL